MPTGIISITVDSTKVENMLNGYQRTIPEGMDKAAKKIASMYAEFYLNQLPQAKGVGTPRGIQPWTGASFIVLNSQRTNPIRTGKGEYVVVVPEYLIALDQMRNHYVSLRRGRSITQWAKQKFPQAFTTLAVKAGFTPKMVVHQHPWIRSANIKAGKNVRKIAEAELNKVIKGKGK